MADREARKSLMIIGSVALFDVAVVLVFGLAPALRPLVLAFALAYAFSPLVDLLARWGWPRGLAVLAIMLVLVVGLAVLTAVFVPMLVAESRDFLKNLPELFAKGAAKASALAARFGFDLPLTREEAIGGLRERIEEFSLSSLKPVGRMAGEVFGKAGSVLTALLNFLLVPIFFFYVLRDLPKMRTFVRELVPPARRDAVMNLFDRHDRVLSGFLRGQLLVASILAVVFSTALSIAGVKFGLFIGILSGFLNIVPYVGQLTGLVLSMAMVLIDYEGPFLLIFVPALFAVTNFVEGTILTPKVVGDKVGLSPLWAMIALIIGGRTAGVAGILVAVPAAGLIRLLVLDAINAYKGSTFYNRPSVSEPV